MTEKTIQKVQQTSTTSEVKSGGIIYAPKTGESFCLNQSGMRLLDRLEQGVDDKILTKPGIKSVTTLLEKAQALKHENERVTLQTKSLHIYPYRQDAKYLPKPLSVMFEVTPACDLRCIYCCVADLDDLTMGRALSKTEMIETIDAIANMGAGLVTITGGEPLMRQRSHGDLFDAIRRLNEHNIRINLFTNGTMIADYASDILNSGIADMSVSLDASTPSLFTELTRRPYFDRVVAGLRAIANQHITIRIAMVMTKLNHQDWPNMLQFVKDMGLDALMMLRAYPIGRACKDQSFIVDDVCWKEITQKIRIYAEERGYKVGGGSDVDRNVMYPFGNCKAGTTFCIVNYDGTVCPCCGFKTFTIGDLRQQPLQDIWESPKLDTFRNKQFVCPVPDRDVFYVSIPKTQVTV